MRLAFAEVLPVCRLPPRQDRPDKDAHVAPGRVGAPHHAEAQALPPGALLELQVVQAHPAVVAVGVAVAVVSLVPRLALGFLAFLVAHLKKEVGGGMLQELNVVVSFSS